MTSVEFLEWQVKLSLDAQVAELMTTTKMDFETANRAVWHPPEDC